jgi:leucyl aminopeptidase
MSYRLAALAALGFAIATPAPAQAQRADAVAAQPMNRPIAFQSTASAGDSALVLPLSKAEDLAARGAVLGEDGRAAVARALAAEDFQYAARKTVSLRGIGPWRRVLVVGMGPTPTPADREMAGMIAGRALATEKAPVTLVATGLPAADAAALATGLGLGEYRSDGFQDTRRSAEAPQAVTVIADAPSEAQALYRGRGRAIVEAMVWTRDVSNHPGNVIYPETFVESARRQFAGLRGVRIEVLDVRAMERLGMGAILGVGRGSARPPRMLIVHYRGDGAPGGGPVVLAGKGITFDSGGISLKEPPNMGNMRMDMSGAASVVGAALALARSRAPVHVVAIAALAENMPDGAAIRPGDVLTAMNGKTIEVVNTDAEGRLVLADALAYADARLNPAVIVDVATLTGAVRTALGDEYAGLFTRHDALADRLMAAGAATGEALWRLPLHESYAKDTSSTYADIRNTGGDAGAGAGTGAHFIGEFVKRETPWAHLDIAGVAYGAASDWKPDGSAGFGVRLLERFVRDWTPNSTTADATSAR